MSNQYKTTKRDEMSRTMQSRADQIEGKLRAEGMRDDPKANRDITYSVEMFADILATQEKRIDMAISISRKMCEFWATRYRGIEVMPFVYTTNSGYGSYTVRQGDQLLGTVRNEDTHYWAGYDRNGDWMGAMPTRKLAAGMLSSADYGPEKGKG